MNNGTTLSAGECRCMHGHTERQSVEKWMERAEREGHSAEGNARVAEGTVMN